MRGRSHEISIEFLACRFRVRRVGLVHPFFRGPADMDLRQRFIAAKNGNREADEFRFGTASGQATALDLGQGSLMKIGRKGRAPDPLVRGGLRIVGLAGRHGGGIVATS